MSERTFSREAFVHSQNQWREGEFGGEWLFYRQLAADRGFIFPPNGTKDDSIEDEKPSQRAMIWRAIDETPQMLVDAIRASRSWTEVIAKLMARRDAMRDDLDLRERQIKWDNQDHPTARQAMVHLSDILTKIKDSAA